ncbi:MAG: radical SAM protein [Deltaproteobacteria bacterium]|jgi:radical SAM protein with 4Fe4S-binding SPASM domain|nr:radical SAM protein [Deltaproteobacteria bacterium]
MNYQENLKPPRLVAWETTGACNLVCRHCRAEAQNTPDPDELNSEQALILIRQLAQFSPLPMVILSGGEPLLRPDILELASLGASLGLRMLLSTNGTLLTSSLANKIKKAGVARLSLSLDAPEADAHDAFRGQIGSFKATVDGALILKKAGLPFQINSAITAENIDQIEAISDLALKLGAVAHHVFLLVPIGRAKVWGSQALPPERYEEALIKLRLREETTTLEFKATCAPQYNRIGHQLGLKPNLRSSRGCLGGQGFMFIGRGGQVGACGYLPLPAGNILKDHPVDIYYHSGLFKELRTRTSYGERCRECEYFKICGGCRARAYAAGDHLGADPLCPYRSAKEG